MTIRHSGREYARWHGRTLVVGAGKAAAGMAAACEAVLKADSVSGLVVTADGCRVPLSAIAVAEAGHPVPDARGLNATRQVCELVGTANTAILCLISGGASSLLVQPRAPVTLDDKIAVNQLLLASGADIAEVNTVRKHLSTVKGGGLVRIARGRPLTALILSDVVGDDPSVIGSGPAAPDPTTYGDAEAVLKRFDLELKAPESVRDLLARGIGGRLSETIKPGDRVADGVVNLVVGSNRTALAAAAKEAQRLGYEVVPTAAPLAGDTAAAARRWMGLIREERRRGDARPRCFLAGGETTVVVRGPGRGGRNQQFALALVEEIGQCPVSLLSAGTDGIDGPTDAAGAFVDGSTFARAAARGLDPAAALQANDSYTFFKELGDLFVRGPTGTNVMDVKIAITPPS